jgi:hypothetical protein
MAAYELVGLLLHIEMLHARRERMHDGLNKDCGWKVCL